MEDESFGRWLKQRRRALDLTQERLAEQVGCAVETIRKIEGGQRRPSRHIAQRLAEQLVTAPEERPTIVQWARLGIVGAPTPPQRPPPPPTNVPSPPTSLVDRVADLQALHHVLRRADMRLLTLVGPPGVGKTRLAVKLATDHLDSFADGVWWVALAPVNDSTLVVPAIAQTLGVKERADQPLIEHLQQRLRHAHMLLLLDNFEHVADAAPSVAHLLAAAPHLKVLVTSRVPLHISGEHEYVVEPLALPTSTQAQSFQCLREHAAVRLFVERAQAVKADFALTSTNAAAVAELCRRLDGLPLAIELAAAHAKLLPPHTLVARAHEPFSLLINGARDLPPRQQTLWNALDWSYALLHADEQALFRRLGVFAGSWTLDAAAAVCADGDRVLPAHSSPLPAALQPVLDGVAALLDKSLLRHVHPATVEDDEEPRWEMLTTIREYAVAQLRTSDEAIATAKRHARYYLHLAETAKPLFTTTQQTVWLERFDRELANVRAVLAWSVAEPERAEGGLRMITSLWWFWQLRGHRREAEVWLERTVAMSTGTRSAARAEALKLWGNVMRSQRNYRHAATLLEESLTLYRALDHHEGIADVLESLGYLAQWQEHYAEATQRFKESLALHQALDSERDVAWLLITLGEVARCQGDYATARRFYQKSLPLHQQLGIQRGTAVALHNLGYVAQQEQSWQHAAACFDSSLALFRDLSDREGIAWCLAGFAGVAAGQAYHADDHAGAWRAARLLGAATKLLTDLAMHMWPADRLEFDRVVAQVRAQLGERVFAAAWAEGQAMLLDDAVTYALLPMHERAVGA